MPVNFIKRHWAECSACGYAIGHASSGSFISAFFLPSMCASCGEYMTRDRDRVHWKHVIQTCKRIPPERSLNPLTWLRTSVWSPVETDSYLVF